MVRSAAIDRDLTAPGVMSAPGRPFYDGKLEELAERWRVVPFGAFTAASWWAASLCWHWTSVGLAVLWTIMFSAELIRLVLRERAR